MRTFIRTKEDQRINFRLLILIQFYWKMYLRKRRWQKISLGASSRNALNSSASRKPLPSRSLEKWWDCRRGSSNKLCAPGGSKKLVHFKVWVVLLSEALHCPQNALILREMSKKGGDPAVSQGEKNLGNVPIIHYPILFLHKPGERRKSRTRTRWVGVDHLISSLSIPRRPRDWKNRTASFSGSCGRGVSETGFGVKRFVSAWWSKWPGKGSFKLQCDTSARIFQEVTKTTANYRLKARHPCWSTYTTDVMRDTTGVSGKSFRLSVCVNDDCKEHVYENEQNQNDIRPHHLWQAITTKNFEKRICKKKKSETKSKSAAKPKPLWEKLQLSLKIFHSPKNYQGCHHRVDSSHVRNRVECSQHELAQSLWY